MTHKHCYLRDMYDIRGDKASRTTDNTGWKFQLLLCISNTQRLRTKCSNLLGKIRTGNKKIWNLQNWNWLKSFCFFSVLLAFSSVVFIRGQVKFCFCQPGSIGRLLGACRPREARPSSWHHRRHHASRLPRDSRVRARGPCHGDPAEMCVCMTAAKLASKDRPRSLMCFGSRARWTTRA